jgi:hypothetical protein
MPLRNLSFDGFLKLVAIAIGYGILIGQVAQIDIRLARVENYILGQRYSPPQRTYVPPADAGERDK